MTGYICLLNFKSNLTEIDLITKKLWSKDFPYPARKKSQIFEKKSCKI